MTDKITDFQHHDNILARAATEIGAALTGPWAHRQDNHGNVQYGFEILCENGSVVDLGVGEFRRNEMLINDAAEKINGTDNEFSLGELTSPLQTRCEHADKTTQR